MDTVPEQSMHDRVVATSIRLHLPAGLTAATVLYEQPAFTEPADPAGVVGDGDVQEDQEDQEDQEFVLSP